MSTNGRHMTTFNRYFSRGAKNTASINAGSNLSFRGNRTPIYTTTEIDRWYLSDFFCATYFIAIEFDSNQKETLQIQVVGRPMQASYSVFGRTSIDKTLINITVNATESYVSVFATPTDSIYNGTNVSFQATYGTNMHTGTFPTTISGTLGVITNTTISSSQNLIQLGSSLRTGVGYTGQYSTWTVGTFITVSSTGLPYHSYGNANMVTVPAAQNYAITSIYNWFFNGGLNVSGTQSVVPGTYIGFALNGVPIFSPSALTSGPTGANPYVPYWNFDASGAAATKYGYSFGADLAGGTALDNNVYSYRDGSFISVWQTGKGWLSGIYGQTGQAEINIISYYNGTLTHPDGHSKIIGWAADGYPIYGPYGYTTPADNTSAIKRMTSGFTLKSSRSAISGVLPPVGTIASGAYPLGSFIQDYAFTGGGDLDIHNGRFCKTPDYPNGTYAYFATIDLYGNPVYPYLLGTTFYGTPALLAGTSYDVSPNAISVNEGATVTYTLLTSGVADGTTLYWTDAGSSSVTQLPSKSGSFTVTNSIGTFTRTPIADQLIEGPRTIIISIRTGSVTGPIVAVASSVTINDTSTPPITYAVSANLTSVNEGSTVTYTVVTTNVADSTTLYWTDSGTSTASQLPTKSGTLTIVSNQGTIPITPVSDLTTEGPRTIVMNVRTGSVSGTIVATASAVTINDTSVTPNVPAYAVSPSSASINEGSAVTFTVTTSNVADGTTLYWTNTGTAAATRFSDGANSGSFTVNLGTATVTRTLLADNLTEGATTIIFKVRTTSISGTVVATSSTVTVNDTSRTPTVAPLSISTMSATKTAIQLGARLSGGSVALAVTNTWAISSNNLVFTGTGLPFHSFYNTAAPRIPYAQSYSKTWTYCGGTNVAANPFVAVSSGNIGFWINGVAIYSPSSQGTTPNGNNPVTGNAWTAWANWHYDASKDAELTLGYSFGNDAAGGLSNGDGSPPGKYFYRDSTAFTTSTAWTSGTGHTSGIYGTAGLAEVTSIPYLNGSMYHSDGHSKIVGWAADGYPIYGPYGYTNASSNTSGIKRMLTGYVLNSVTRTTVGGELPDAIAYPLGTFVEDYTYTGVGDLDVHNGRYCVTPDYPSGTYAYFCTIDSSLSPTYPYVIGNTFYGTPASI